MYVHMVRANSNVEINNDEINNVLFSVDKSMLKTGDIIKVNNKYDLEVKSFDGVIIELVIIEL